MILKFVLQNHLVIISQNYLISNSNVDFVAETSQKET